MLFSMLEKILPEDACIYKGIVNENAVNTVQSALSCHKGDKVRVIILRED